MESLSVFVFWNVKNGARLEENNDSLVSDGNLASSLEQSRKPCMLFLDILLYNFFRYNDRVHCGKG